MVSHDTMRITDLLTDYQKINEKYEELLLKIIKSNKPTAGLRQKAEAVNKALNQKLEKATFKYVEFHLPEFFLLGLNKVKSSIPEAQRFHSGVDIKRYLENPNSAPAPLRILISGLMDKTKALAGERMKTSFGLKGEYIDLAFSAKERFAREIAESKIRLSQKLLEQAGFKERRKAVEETLRQSSKGIIGDNGRWMFRFKKRDGTLVRMSYENYARVLEHQVTANAFMDGHAQHIVDAGSHLAQIPTNSTTRDECKNWEGKIVSITGKDVGRRIRYRGKTYEVLSFDALRQPDVHIFHPNCRHFSLLYVDPAEVFYV